MSDTTDDSIKTATGSADEASAADASQDRDRDGLIDVLSSALGDGVVETHVIAGKDLWVRVDAGSWVAAAAELKAGGFTYFSYLSAIDWMPSPYGRGEDDPTAEPQPRPTETVQGYAGGATRFQVFARLVSLPRRLGVTLKVDVPEDTLAIDTWVRLFAGANWHERETHEMFGITFTGHPDLRNLYLPGEFEGYPLRKDFPLLARMIKPWPGIVDVEPLPAEDPDDAPETSAGEPGVGGQGGEASAGEDVNASDATAEGSASDARAADEDPSPAATDGPAASVDGAV